MKFKNFLMEKSLYIVLIILSLIMIEVLLMIYEINLYIRICVILLPMIALIISIISEYIVKNSFYKRLKVNLNELDDKYLISEIINNPNFSSNLSSGLKKVDINYQTIVIAGMGFATIKEIVLDDIKKGHKRETFIIDCHTNQNEVRSFFYELGYKIDRILTGGYSKIIRNEIVCFHYEEDLALEGLYQIYLLNNGGKE